MEICQIDLVVMEIQNLLNLEENGNDDVNFFTLVNSKYYDMKHLYLQSCFGSHNLLINMLMISGLFYPNRTQNSEGYPTFMILKFQVTKN